MTAPPAPVSSAREKFLAAVRAANLFAPMYLAKVEATVPANVATATDAARALIAAGHLTKFQAERLLAGKTDGFHLGPYVILEQVGRGSMGRVYKARHQTMNRPVAVKVISAELTKAASARKALQQQVRAAAQLNHPNIVTAYDANELGERFYLVLELVDGPNLETMVKERGPLPISEVCELLRQAAMGLEHAHELGMVHQDIKPSNLLVSRPSKTTPDQLLKIADFGIAKLGTGAATLAQTPAPGVMLGTPDYAAPEQTNHPELADKKVDLYSLGAVAYFLLTAQPPFPGGTAEDKAKRHLWEEPARLELIRPDTPPALAILVHQMLAKHPAHRPESAAEVAARADSLLAAFGDAISFDLPAVQSGPYSFTAGQLSGILQMPPDPAAYPGSGIYGVPPSSGQYAVPGSGQYGVPNSGHYAVPGSGHYAVPGSGQHAMPGSGHYAVPAPEPTPQHAWSQASGSETHAETDEPTEEYTSRAMRRHRGNSGGSMITSIMILVVAVAAVAGMGLAAMKFMK